MDYALHANRKSLYPTSSLHRDQQFRYLNSHRQQFSRSGYPIISVDTKKKELVGQFKNNGRVWSQEPILVQDHHFRPKPKVWPFLTAFPTSKDRNLAWTRGSDQPRIGAFGHCYRWYGHRAAMAPPA